MPPLQLTNLLQEILPHLSYKGRAVLSALGCVNGRAPSSVELAAWLGFQHRCAEVPARLRACSNPRLPEPHSASWPSATSSIPQSRTGSSDALPAGGGPRSGATDWRSHYSSSATSAAMVW